MKTIYHLFFAAVVLGCLATGCKKNIQDKEYKDTSRLMISGDFNEGARGDSIVVSFASVDDAVLERKVSMLAYTMGYISDKPREFKISVDPASNALPEEYELPATFVVPARATVARIPITLKRSDRLKNLKVKLILKLEPNDNFQLSERIRRNEIDMGPTFQFHWTAQLVRFRYWNSGLWGGYSYNKHRFLLNSQDLYKDFDLIPLSELDRAIGIIAARATKALYDYNQANPGNPILNDANPRQPIQICSACP
ncbi:DUF4843 domain-containing protein [Pedobacter deserti]|uniref:DUF4843 domain-containing protein n=1 Tax=Pedobacter deserti TaxID=2817382 RepID=UPI002109071F|nr:DUF4843 domain-containing protein [Pedobacter sp. SYSU D00382]